MKEIEICLHPNKTTKFINRGWNVLENASLSLQNNKHHLSITFADGNFIVKAFDLDECAELNNEVFNQVF